MEPYDEAAWLAFRCWHAAVMAENRRGWVRVPVPLSDQHQLGVWRPAS